MTLHLISGLEPILSDRSRWKNAPTLRATVMPPAPAGGITVQSAGGKEIANPLKNVPAEL